MSTGTCPQCGVLPEPGGMVCANCGAWLGPPPPTDAAATPLAPQPVLTPTAPPPAGPAAAAAPLATAASAKTTKPTGRTIWLLLAVAALVVGGIFVFSKSGDDDKAAPTGGASSTTVVTGSSTSSPVPTSSLPEGTLDPSSLGAGEVLLEPVNSTLAEPFMPSVSTETEAAPTVSLPPIPLPTTSAPLSEGQVALPQVAGREPGLYGGTRDAKACDAQSMISFLEQNPDKAAAWAGVQGIAVSEIRAFIEGLTAVVLTRDTRVTNHGFRNGQAFSHPSVLQAGHAVLVDRWGVPRAKCSCGNPLTPPQVLTTPPTYVGPQWPTFDPTIIIVVIATEPVDEGFVIVDFPSGDLIIRTVGGGDTDSTDLGTGAVRVTLRWADAADLDLSVTDPTGETVSYGVPSVSSGGVLDVDANASCNSPTSSPAENIIWPDTAPDGRYVVTVDLYSSCDAGDLHAYELTAYIDDVPVQLYLGGDDGSLSPTDGSGALTSETPTVTYTFGQGDVPDDPDVPDPGTDPETNTAEAASLQILDLLLLDCGYEATFTNLGPVDGGWYWSVATTGGDAEFIVYEPLGEWAVVPNNEQAATIATACGFYSP